jgi:hypothetical protein
MNHNIHWVQGLAPIADAFAGATVNSDIVKCESGGAIFLIYRGVGATGTSTVTVEACDNVTPSNTTAVPFIYRENTSGDTWGDWTAATTAGWTTTAGRNAIFEVYVDAAELAEEGYGYVRLDMAESVNSPVLGGILIGLIDTRYAVVPATLIT